MDRRTFLKRSAMLAGGALVIAVSPALADVAVKAKRNELSFDSDLYKQFQNPASKYHPFVRWWWNGDKVEAGELVRELHLLKNAGIGGVEINPISFPTTGDDLGKKSLKWLSDEWIDMLNVTFAEAKKLDMTCDLIVGSGWPFGSEDLKGNDRAQAVYIDAEKIEGPTTYEVSQLAIFKNVDPQVTDPNPRREFEIISLKLVPDPMNSLADAVDVSDKRHDEIIRVDVPAGVHYLYATVKITAFASVINGAPGAAGTILNHMDKGAVRRYLDHMSDTIERKTGPLKEHIRAFFADSLELEGSNWTSDFAEEFKKRRGYDMMPYLPFILLKTGRLGAVIKGNVGATKSPELQAELNRMRFDFELTKAELLFERYIMTYVEWCRDKGVDSRAQAYGRGLFQLENSLYYTIPEGESWTSNWLKHRLGEEMGDEDYRRGRGYTYINKFVSSAMHLAGRRIMSCEEMTNTYNVFNATLEFLKIGSDMSIISGVTHSVWHGFNYSPPEAPFPGWVQYGSYHNENNNYWPYFKYLNQYKARLSSQLQNADMYTDIALLTANYDMWTDEGVKTDPFPEELNVPYMPLVWEAIHKNGGAADITTEIMIGQSEVRDGKLCYGPKAYGTLFLIEVSGTSAATLAKLYEMVSQGGRVFCIGCYPSKSLGLLNYQQRDQEVKEWVEKLKTFPDQFILLEKPADGHYLEWYKEVMEKYDIPHYLTIDTPDRFLMQNRYVTDDDSQLFFFLNAHMHEPKRSRITFSETITRKRYPWVWDANTGEKYRIELNEDGSYDLNMGPAESRLIVFDREKKGPMWNPLPVSGSDTQTLTDWEVELHHSREGWVKTTHMDSPVDLKETEFVNFTGTVVYRTSFEVENPGEHILNLGKVWGINELYVNGEACPVKWFGYRIYDIADLLRPGTNQIEVRVVTNMGNYMHTLTDNETAQKFTAGRKEQLVQSMGMVGPITLYK